jgi:hypothetical protein
MDLSDRILPLSFPLEDENEPSFLKAVVLKNRSDGWPKVTGSSEFI